MLRHDYGNFSTHDLTQRSTLCFSFDSFPSIFQLTTSRRGRQEREIKTDVPVVFNSRPHAEVDHRKACCTLRGYLFNSRPHAEVDKAARKGGCMRKFSTHDLTQRSTTDYGYFDNQAGFSTHDLTQRSTTDYGYFDNQAGFSTHDLTQRSTWGNEV